jgi:hypothetical protein
VGKRLASLSDKRVDITVPTEIRVVTMPIAESSTPKTWCISGQAEPSSESGRPRLINAKYMIAKSSDVIKYYLFARK